MIEESCGFASWDPQQRHLRLQLVPLRLGRARADRGPGSPIEAPSRRGPLHGEAHVARRPPSRFSHGDIGRCGHFKPRNGCRRVIFGRFWWFFWSFWMFFLGFPLGFQGFKGSEVKAVVLRGLASWNLRRMSRCKSPSRHEMLVKKVVSRPGRGLFWRWSGRNWG